MKRGLVLLDPQEIPPFELGERVTRLQHSLQQQGLAAALIYGDVYHSGDITYLSNICIYWNEGLLAVPAKGKPALMTKLSSRVHPWMRATSTLEDLYSGPNLAESVGRYLGQTVPGTVGLAEMGWWPAPLVDDLQARLSGWRLLDLGPIIRQERNHPSGSELRLIQRSAGIGAAAVTCGLDPALTNPERAGRAERTARMAGVEDVCVFCHPATRQADTVEVLVEYRGYWTLAARVLLHGSPGWAQLMRKAYAAAEQEVTPGTDIARVRLAADAVLADSGIAWRMDLIQHPDLETMGDLRLPDEDKYPVRAGSVVGLRLEFSFPDGTQAVAADTFAIGDDGARRLTEGLAPVFLQS